jgi:hypothetical protein
MTQFTAGSSAQHAQSCGTLARANWFRSCRFRGRRRHQARETTDRYARRARPSCGSVINRSRNSLPGLKKGIALSGTTTCCPVRGLRPGRLDRCLAEKTPNPRSSMRSPLASPATISSRIASTIFNTSDRYSVGLRSAIRSTSSDLITGYPKLSANSPPSQFQAVGSWSIPDIPKRL